MEWSNNTEERPVKEIRWKGLTDKNSDKLYSPKQLLPQNDYDAETRKYLRGVSQNTGYYWMEQEGTIRNN